MFLDVRVRGHFVIVRGATRKLLELDDRMRSFMDARRWVIAIWLCFLVRIAFYSSALPLWEGFDEWSYFAVLRRVALRGELLVSRDAPIPKDIQASLELAPVPWELRGYDAPSITEDAFWQLPPEDRQRRQGVFRSFSLGMQRDDAASGLKAYEALQPPLYSWLMAPVVRLLASHSLAEQVMAIRWFSALVASTTIPLAFLAGRAVLGWNAGIGVAAVIAVMPEFAIDTFRISNECISVPLYTLVIWLALRIAVSEINYKKAVMLGLALGFGLLTKAYFLTAIPPLAIIFVRSFYLERFARRRVAISAFICAALPMLVAGWWYARNLVTTGTLSGLSEAVLTAHHRQAGLSHVFQIHWISAIDSIVFSHIWFGAWSSLTVRSWIYHLFYLLICVSAAGLIRTLRETSLWILAAFYGFFWIGELYNVLLLFAAKGASTSMGWYMYAVVAAEVTLCIAGLRVWVKTEWQAYIPAIGVAFFGLLDLYTLNGVAIPYYTGIIAHLPNGTLRALHWNDLSRLSVGETFSRLAIFKGPWVSQPLLVILWFAYLVATLCLIAIALYLATSRRINSEPEA
jgi:hypothetical protein